MMFPSGMFPKPDLTTSAFCVAVRNPENVPHCICFMSLSLTCFEAVIGFKILSYYCEAMVLSAESKIRNWLVRK